MALSWKQIISTVVLGFVLLLAQIPFVPPFDADDIRTAIIMLPAIAMFGLFFVLGWVGYKTMISLSVFFVYAILLEYFTWVPGMTGIEIAELVGLCGIIVLASESKKAVIVWAIVGAAILQMATTYLFGFKWSADYALPWNKHYYDWGTVRHATRYGAILICGISACIALYSSKSTKMKWILCAVISAIGASIMHSWSNIAMLVMLLIVMVWLGSTKAKWTMWLVVCLAFLWVTFTKPQGFVLDGGRESMWLTVLKETGVYPLQFGKEFIFGFGSGGWERLCGTIGYQSCGHPHSVFAELLFNYGMLGLFLFFGMLISIVLFGGDKKFSIVGLAAILLCVAANSLFNYSDMELMFGTWAGMVLNEETI